MKQYTHFSFEQVGSVFILRLRSSILLDPSVFIELTDELLDFVSMQRPSVVVLTFEYVKRFSSNVINVLLTVRERIVNNGRHFMLCEMRREIREVFTMLHLDFEIYHTLNETLDMYEEEEIRACIK